MRGSAIFYVGLKKTIVSEPYFYVSYKTLAKFKIFSTNSNVSSFTSAKHENNSVQQNDTRTDFFKVKISFSQQVFLIKAFTFNPCN